MMRSQITLAGNLGGDPELRFTPTGTAVCTFSVAVGSRVKNAAGVWEDGPTSWFNIVTFKELSEDCAEQLRKGSKVLVAGVVSVEDWTDKEGGKRRSVKVVADEVGVNVRQSRAQRGNGQVAPDVWGAGQDGEAPF
jgi:single-strand DNA-binding protein